MNGHDYPLLRALSGEQSSVRLHGTLCINYGFIQRLEAFAKRTSQESLMKVPIPGDAP